RQMVNRCLGNLSPDCPFLAKSGEMLREMARCGIVHFDMPLFDEAAEGKPTDMTKRDPEIAVIEGETQALASAVRTELQSLYRALKPGARAPSAIQTLNQEIANELDSFESGAALRRISRERAGLPTEGAGRGLGIA